MRVQVALKLPNGTLHYQIFDGVEALINPRHVLQIFTVYHKQLVAEFPPDSYVSWHYVATPQQPMASRARVLLIQHHEK